MKFSIRFADQIVGALVVLAIAILIVVVFMIGKNQRWFAKDAFYKTYLESASGVSKSMPIQYRGFTIGRVKDFELTSDDRVEVVFSVFEEYVHRVTEGSLVEVQAGLIPALGNSFIFHPGKGTALIPMGDLIPEKTSAEAKPYIARGLSDIPPESDSINDIVNNVNAILETINISLAGSQGAEELPLGQILIDLQRTMSQVSDPSGSVMSLLDGQGPFYQSIEDSLVSLSGIIENLNKTSEFIPEQLPQIAVLINELNTAMRSVQDVLTAIANNPLLRGGIPERVETGPGGASPRNLDF